VPDFPVGDQVLEELHRLVQGHRALRDPEDLHAVRVVQPGQRPHRIRAVPEQPFDGPPAVQLADLPLDLVRVDPGALRQRHKPPSDPARGTALSSGPRSATPPPGAPRTGCRCRTPPARSRRASRTHSCRPTRPRRTPPSTAAPPASPGRPCPGPPTPATKSTA